MDTAENNFENLTKEDLQRRELRTLLSLGLSGSDAARFLMGTWGMDESAAQRALQAHGYIDGDVSPALETGLEKLAKTDPV